jgi:hypothetical protein
LAAAERDIVLRDFTGRGFAPDLVRYTVRTPAAGAKAFRLTGPDGQAVALQVSGLATGGVGALSFVAELPADGTAAYRLRDDGQGPAAASDLRVMATQEATVMQNGLLAVRLPPAMDRRFSPPVPASSLAAPILGFRSGAGPWIGGGRILTERPVSEARVTVTETGPVFAELAYELRFAAGGYYRARIVVTDRVPLARVTEEFDAGELAGNDCWELSLTAGWDPDTIEVASATSGTGMEKDSIAPIASIGPTPNPIQPAWTIIPDSAWYAPRTMLGVFNSSDRAANSNAYPVAGFVPINKGDWRRTIGVDIHTANYP